MDADATENSAGLLFDPDGMYDDSFDGLSIDIGEIYAILDEEPAPDNLKATAQGLQHGEPVLSQFDLEQRPQGVSVADLENCRGRGHSQWNVEIPDSHQELEFGFHKKSEGNHNIITGAGNPNIWQHFDSNDFYSAPQNSSNGSTPSCPNNNYPISAFGGPSGSFLTGNFDQPHLQVNREEYSVRDESIRRTGLVSFPVASDNSFYFNGNEEDSKRHDLEFPVKTEYDDSRHNKSHTLFTRNLQNRETGSHVLSLGNFDLNDGLHDSINSNAFPVSTVEDGNMYSSAVYMDTDSGVPCMIKPEMKTFEASNATYDGKNSCLTLSGYSISDAEIGLPQLASAQFQQGYPSDIKLHTKDESPDSSLGDVSITDLDAPLSNELISDYNYSDDASLMSESSTESSPMPSSRSSSSDHVSIGVLNPKESLVSGFDTTWPSKPKLFLKDERVDKVFQPAHKPKGGGIAGQKTPPMRGVSTEDDADICILDDISDPACPPSASLRSKLHFMSQRPEFSDTRYHGIGGMGLRQDDERLTFQLALQDLSQPNSEANPPDGVLAVPLLRHQRIALSWMVQKETKFSKCSGGILADDQGLGKTVSTIALILLERSPSARSIVVKKEDEFEALNLDDDDDDADVSVMQQPCDSVPMMSSKPFKKESSVTAKARPAAGTLVVCPTSVLRQWADELQTKVTSKANLSFLVYHGSNRTKDPNELAKYDVVLTTYAIVSMEVPKQQLMDKDDEEIGKQDTFGLSSGLSNGKKRKDPPTSNTKSRKGTSTVDGLLDSAVRPLGRVRWFRVILDEAQSIKNYRTQVARACWGLHAKRRWCLSGTPIQNAVDDLYSYFRFLRYDTLSKYKYFCSTIKTPISRNPTSGYKKLQAILKTIMLRRTKGTTLDGKPIITLPSKTISLKKVNFSVEERAFYSTLEAESREQFMEYEDAGTVKQNYVNILLMLLRLRQACDHPLLVKGFDSNSSQKSSMEMAKKLPREKKVTLLTCLEVSLAICTICNDPPEDAVVSICGHVFCNQCICEHLTADENICPSPNCKAQLRAASVFSRDTLKCSLSDELSDDCCSRSSGFEMGNKHKKPEDTRSSVSSKIKAALEILQSLPRLQCSSESNVETSEGEFSDASTNTASSFSGRSSLDSNCVEHINSQRYSRREVSEKAIVFSQWTRMLDLLEGPLKASCIQYRRLDGTMSVVAREKAIKDFNTLPEVTVIIMSLKAASLGLNLVVANHVLLLDLWWNPTTEDQAIDRAHRIGQTRPVTVSRLTVKDTVEDKILSLQEKKREMVASAFGEDESGSRQTRLTVDDLRYLFTV